MSSAIEQVWSGRADFVEHFGKNSHQVRRLETILYRRLDMLEETLDQKQKEAYQICYEKILEYVSEVQRQSFCDGFCIGGRLTAEALIGAQDLMKYNE